MKFLAVAVLAAMASAQMDSPMRCLMEVPEDPLPDCPNSDLFFPNPETQTYMLRGYLKEENAQVFENQEAGLLLIYKRNETADQMAAEASVEAQQPTYLEQEEYGANGGWYVLSTKERKIIAFAHTTSIMDQMVPGDEMDFWVCGQMVHVEIDCSVRETSPHLEAAIEGAPCTIFGDCSGEDGLVCGMYNPQHAVCMKPEKAEAEGVRIVNGVQRAAPYSNCYYSRECLVEGFQCFQNTLYTEFAWCLYPEVCPKRTGAELLRAEQAGEVMKPPGRRLLTDWTKEESTPQGALKKFKASLRKAQGKAPNPGKQRRRLFEQCVQEGVLGSADTADDMHFGSGDETTSKAKKFQDVTYKCGKVHFDIATVYNDEPLHLDLQLIGETGTIQTIDGAQGFNEDPDKLRTFVDENNDTLEQEVKNWLHKEWHDLGGREGWNCEEPLGPIATADMPGVITKAEYRAICAAQGMNPHVCAPLNEEERAHRRRRRLQAKPLADFATELGTFRGAETAETGLPPPPEEEHEWNIAFVCPGVPSVGKAPAKVYAPELICGPTYAFAPAVDVGSTWIWAPVFTFASIVTIVPFCTWGPYFTFAVSVFGGVEFAFAPIFLFAPLCNLGPLVELAPLYQFIPVLSIAPISTVAANINLVPDVVEYWKFSRGDFPPSKVKRFEDKGKFIAKDTKFPDLAEATEFFYGELLPVNDIIDKVTSVPAGGLPISEEKAKKLGLKKSYTLGSFISVATGPSIVCPRRIIGLADGSCPPELQPYDCPFPKKYKEYRGGKNIRIFYIEPIDSNTFIFGDHCLVPYPSDVLRDMPFLPKWAYPAIALAESIENLIPKPVKVAANSALSLLQVVSEGGYPDPEAWLRSLYGESTDDKIKGASARDAESFEYLDKNYTGTPTYEAEYKNMTKPGVGSKMTWLKAFEIAAIYATDDQAKGGIFSKDFPLVKAARGELKFDEMFKEIAKPFFGSA